MESVDVANVILDFIVHSKTLCGNLGHHSNNRRHSNYDRRAHVLLTSLGMPRTKRSSHFQVEAHTNCSPDMLKHHTQLQVLTTQLFLAYFIPTSACFPPTHSYNIQYSTGHMPPLNLFK